MFLHRRTRTTARDLLSGAVMAERLREAYKSLFQAHEYANKLDKAGLTEKLKALRRC